MEWIKTTWPDVEDQLSRSRECAHMQLRTWPFAHFRLWQSRKLIANNHYAHIRRCNDSVLSRIGYRDWENYSLDALLCISLVTQKSLTPFI